MNLEEAVIKMRYWQKMFFKSSPKSRERQEAFKEALKYEKIVDGILEGE